MAKYTVLDVSKYNNVTSYDIASSSINGVIIRVGYRGYGASGTLTKDSSFETHYNGFAGKTKLGIYWFSQAISEAEAIAEANYVYNIIKTKQLDFPIYIDSEYSNNNHNGRADSLNKVERTAITIAFCDRIRELGYRAGVYASDAWYKSNLDLKQLEAKKYSLWVARYSSTPPANVSNYDGWQFSSSNIVNGISGRCDLSYFYNDIAGWDTTKPDINSYHLDVPNQIFDYNGEQIKPSFTLGNLENSIDYTYYYENNINAGTGRCVIVGVNNYQGIRTFDFTINPITINDKKITLTGYGFTYTGSEIKPGVSVSDLSESDYDVTYADNINIGSAKAIVTGKGNYKDSIYAIFAISQRYINTLDISIPYESYKYTGDPITPEVSIPGLTKGNDFTVEYLDNINLGIATINVRGINNYTGIETLNFRIATESIDMSGYNVTMSYTSTVYNRNNQLPDITVEGLTENIDYKIIAENNLNVGTATVKIIGINDYTGTIVKTFEILKCNIDQFTLEIPQDKYEYTGSAIKPEPTISNLIAGEDYDIEYNDNINVGVASITCTAKGNYEGVLSVTFTITTCEIKFDMVTLSNYTYIYDGTQKTPNVSVKGLIYNVDYIVKYLDNTNAGTAYAIINGIGNYKDEVSVPFTINRQFITDRKPVIESSSYHYNILPICPEVYISDLILNKDYKVEYFDNINVGTARLIITGINNYQGEITLKYNIIEKDISTCIAKYGIPSVKTIYRIEDGRGLRVYTDMYEKNQLAENLHYQINTTTIKELEDFNIVTYTVKGLGGFSGDATFIFRYVLIEPDIPIDLEDDGVYNFGEIEYADMSAYGNYDFKDLDDKEPEPEDPEAPDIVKDGQDYDFDSMSGMLLDKYDEDDGSNIDSDGSDKKDPDDQKKDDGTYNFGDIDEDDETAVGDYDFGDLDEGVDPDSVANGDYDFNKLAGDIEEWIAAGTEFELKDTPMYSTYSIPVSFDNKSGSYYVYNSALVNGRVRMARTENAVDMPARSSGWCKTIDLLNLGEITVGEQVLVNGKLYLYATGNGGYIDGTGQVMYVCEIKDKELYPFPFGLTNGPKGARIGYASESSLSKPENL